MKTDLARRYKERRLLGPVAAVVERNAVRATYEAHDRFLSNSASRKQLRAHAPQLDPTQQRILGDLRAEGISVLPFQDLFTDPTVWAGLKQHADAFSARTEETLANPPAEPEPAPGKKPKKNQRKKKKDYVVRSHDRNAPMDPTNPWLQLAVAPQILDTVNAYLGLWAKLTYVDVWYTVPRGDDEAERVASQRWHRDYNDRHLVKVFIYTTDVDEGAGPFEYVRGSVGGAHAKAWPWRPLGDTYPPQEEFDKQIPASDVITLTGSAGTMILCNTSGFHRGGFATHTRRVMGVLNFVSPAAVEALCERNFSVDPDAVGDLGAAARFALT
jgi:hypothetical protein